MKTQERTDIKRRDIVSGTTNMQLSVLADRNNLDKVYSSAICLSKIDSLAE
jgi:hypothetical protein